MTLPEIRIKNSWLFVEALDPWMRPVFEKDGYPEILDAEFLDGKVKEFTEAWRQYEQKILGGMCEALDLEFRQNIIDMYVAPFQQSFSEPMVIASRTPADRAASVIAHEVLHRLLTDNTKVQPDDLLANDWWDMFGKEHSFVTVVHIPVHALLKHLFLDILNEPELLKRDIDEQESNDYRLAWQYVQENDYKAIIQKLQNSYERRK